MDKTSSISGFYKLSVIERRKKVAEFAELTDEEEKAISNASDSEDVLDMMVENVIGTLQLPLGVATNFKINGKDYLVPMSTEESSVIAAASNAAKMARIKGGFTTESTDPVMIGQVQIVDITDANDAKEKILANKQELLELASAQDPILLKFGGGPRDVEVKIIDTEDGPMLDVHLLVDVRDAMGANAVNTMVEAVSSELERLSGGKTLLKIISNLAVHRMAKARAVFAKEALGGEDVVDRIIKSYIFAKNDIYRCATHNKGIMNGIIAVAMATGQDHRAIEAGGHVYAAKDGGYKSLTKYSKDAEGNLVGDIELPMAVATIGGATKVHPAFRVCQKILGASNSRELAEVIVAVGLAQNLAALRALSDEGIQKGHMSLHARNLAVMAGASGKMIDEVASQMVSEGSVKMSRAKEIIENLS